MNASRCLRSLRPPLPSNQSKGFHTTPQSFEASSRRLTKALRIPPAPSYISPTSAQEDHIIYNPPSSVPNVHHTPLKFLPSGDSRRRIYAKVASVASATTTAEAASPIARTRTALAAIASRIPHTASPVLPVDSSLPAPVREPYEKKYHLGEEEVAEIRALREKDPIHWSRRRLAKKFDCSDFFIGTVCRNPIAEKRHWTQFNEARDKMSRGRREAREDRQRRKQLWGRE